MSPNALLPGPGSLKTCLGFDWEGNFETSSDHENFIRSIDWPATAIGHPSQWPPQLKESVDFVLADPTPAAVMWGEDLIMIYNEGFATFAGAKHPYLMGKSPKTEYAEVWAMFVDIIERGRTTGQATRHENVQLFLNRFGYSEEVYVSYTFIPILGPDKTVAGFYHTAFETTAQVLAARRMQTLLAIGDSLTASRSIHDYWDNLLKVLEEKNGDMHWALAYSFANDEGNESGSETESSVGSPSPTRIPRSCTLAGATHKAMGKVPLSFDRRDDKDSFMRVIKKAVTYGETALLSHTNPDMPSWIFELGSDAEEGERCRTALLIPIRPTTKSEADGTNVIGFLVIGIAPFRGYDKDYEQFVRLFSRQLATSAASIMLLEQEIRRQKQLAEQLSSSARQTQELERKFSRFAEISNIGMWIASPKGELLYANKAWYEQASIPFNTHMTVEKWAPFVTDESITNFAQQWSRLMESHEPINFECQFKARWRSRDPTTGELLEGARWFLVSAFPEFAEDGSLKSAWGCNVDVSYQKWAQCLKDERLREILEAKRQTENFIDMTSHEMRNPLSAILQSADNIASTIEDAEKKRSTGSMLEFDPASVESIADSASTIMACASHQKRIVDDILTLSKLDASLLVVTPDEVDPVATVQHALQLHQQEFKSAGVEGCVRIDCSYYDLQVGRVFLDPSRLLQILINLLTNAIKFTQFQPERRVTLHLSASVAPPVEGTDDAQWFAPRQIGKMPDLNADWGVGEDLHLAFSVEDTGCGLSEEEMQRLFTRFGQASPKTHVQYGGSGLGLFICKELTELQGGRIGVTSTPGIGSTFKFYLKVRRAVSMEKAIEVNAKKLETVTLQAEAEAEANNCPSAKAVTTLKDPEYIHPVNRGNEGFSNPVIGSAKSTDTLHVLIVEDNLINQKVMANQLRKANCIVHVAGHGADALIFLKKTTFAKDCGPNAVPLSIVLMDLEMPVMDGLTCVRRIRESQKNGDFTRPVPVIAVTANARLEQVKNAKENGMDDVVTKPFRIKDLIPQIYNLIEKVSV